MLIFLSAEKTFKKIRYTRKQNVRRYTRETRRSTHQLMPRKQKEGETHENYHSVFNRLAARCNLGTLERRTLRDVFIVKKKRTRKYRLGYVELQKRRMDSTVSFFSTNGEIGKLRIKYSSGAGGVAASKDGTCKRYPRGLSTTLPMGEREVCIEKLQEATRIDSVKLRSEWVHRKKSIKQLISS